MDQELLNEAYQASLKGKSYALATIIDSTIKGTPRKAGSKMIVFEDGQSLGTIGGGRNEGAVIKECMQAIKNRDLKVVSYDYFGKEGQSICGGQIKVLIEPFAAKRRMLICGGGHIALPVTVIAKMIGFNVSVIDHRQEFADGNRFKHVDQIFLGKYADNIVKYGIDENTAVIVVTAGNEYDFECLKAVIKSKAFYVGVISSQAKRVKFFKRLQSLKINKNLFDRIDIPMGIDIGAQTPEEIAVSICAQVIATYNKKFIKTDKFKSKFTN